MSEQHHPDPAPDPDEDDLDDLDDVLDHFNTAKISAPAQSGPGRPGEATTAETKAGDQAGTTAKAGDAATDSTSSASNKRKKPEPASLEDYEFDPEEFQKELEAHMAQTLHEIDTNPVMQAQIKSALANLEAKEKMGKKSGAGAGAGSAKAGSSSTGDAFQDTIRKTMERMQESGAQAGAAAQSSGEEDLFAQMLAEMQKGGMGGEGGDEDFSKMLLGMMEQLTNKDILYEPMKELHDKFPAWMTENRAKTPKDDLARYEEQQKLVGEIVARFERPGYKDENADDREYIVERMQKMQEAGSPPADLVGDMNAAQEALGDIDAGCPQQ